MSSLLKQCPPIEALTQAVSEGMSPILQRHLQTCERCALLVEEEREASSLLHGMTLREPSPAQHQDAKMALFAAAKATPIKVQPFPWVKVLMNVAASVLVVVGVYYWFFTKPEVQELPVAAESRGTIFAGNQAQFHHETKPGDETVRLTEGSIKVDVAHLKPGERFRVIVGDAEVEVRGTSFEVVAHNDKLISVKVIEGAVEVRTKEEGTNAAPVVLHLAPGERWVSAEQIAASETVEPVSLPTIVPVTLPASEPVVEPASEPVSKPAAKPVAAIKIEEPSSKEDDIYSAALAAKRAGDYTTAIKGFAEVSKSSNADVAEDASYEYAVCLYKSKSSETKVALEGFVQKYPRSQRAHDARILLGWLLLESGNLEAAKTQFEQVVQNAPEALRQKAQGGLDIINKRSALSPAN